METHPYPLPPTPYSTGMILGEGMSFDVHPHVWTSLFSWGCPYDQVILFPFFG